MNRRRFLETATGLAGGFAIGKTKQHLEGQIQTYGADIWAMRIDKVFLNGRDVTELCGSVSVPGAPYEFDSGFGYAELYRYEEEGAKRWIVSEADGLPHLHRRYGLVKIEWAARDEYRGSY